MCPFLGNHTPALVNDPQTLFSRSFVGICSYCCFCSALTWLYAWLHRLVSNVVMCYLFSPLVLLPQRLICRVTLWKIRLFWRVFQFSVYSLSCSFRLTLVIVPRLGFFSSIALEFHWSCCSVALAGSGLGGLQLWLLPQK